MKLYLNSLSPFARKVRITLFEKGCDFDAVEIDRGAARAELLRVNPRGEVPVLADGETVVADSTRICDYLEDRFPKPPLLPADPAGRARARRLERIADGHTDVLQFLAHLVTVRRPELAERVPDLRAALAAEIERHYAFLDAELEGREWLCDRFGRAEAALLPHLTALAQLWGPMPERCAALAAWLARGVARPAVSRDIALALAAWERQRDAADPFFRDDRVHWRSERVEWALRLGLGEWLLEEQRAGRAYFSAPPA